MAEESGRRPDRRWLWGLMAAHLLLATAYLVILPLWGAVPDEPLHYSHIKYVGEFWRIPLIQNPFRDLREYYFTADPAGTAEYGVPYYWPLAVVFWLTRWLTVTAQQYVLRACSVLFGLAVVWFAWRSFELVFPRHPEYVVPATALVVVWPTRLEFSAVIYNDVGAIFYTSLAVLALVYALMTDRPERGWLLAGLATGLAVLCKPSALILGPTALVMLIWQWRDRRDPFVALLQRAGLGLLGGLITCGWWFARNLVVYGQLMPVEWGLGSRSWSELLATYPLAQVWWQVGYVVRGTWLSTWSQVGWLPDWAALPMYLVLGLVSLLVIVGVVLGMRGGYRGLSQRARIAVVSFVLAAVVLYVASVQWTLLHSFHNNEEGGKFAMAVLIGLVIAVVGVFRGLMGESWDRRALWAVVALLMLFNVLAMWNLLFVLNPRWAPEPPPLAGRKVEELPSGSVAGIKHRYYVPGARQVHDYYGDQPQADGDQHPAP